MWIPRKVWEHLQSTMNGLQERNDRLTEALARKEGGVVVDLPRPAPHESFVRPLESIGGYFDVKKPAIVPEPKTSTGGNKP